MSLMTQAIVAETYGLRLSMDQLAKALGIARNTIYNHLAYGASASRLRRFCNATVRRKVSVLQINC